MRRLDWEAYNRQLESNALIVRADALLKRQIIDAGVRAMSLKLHPDTGGSHEAMLALNRCAAELRHAYPQPKPVRKKRKPSKSVELRQFLRREAAAITSVLESTGRGTCQRSGRIPCPTGA